MRVFCDSVFCQWRRQRYKLRRYFHFMANGWLKEYVGLAAYRLQNGTFGQSVM